MYDRIAKSSLPVQAKLVVGPQGDKYEQEADRIAAEVVQRMQSPQASWVQPPPDYGNEIQMQPMVAPQSVGAGNLVSAELEAEINGARGQGRSLDAGLQSSMGQAMGVDFSGVRVHTDARSDQLNRSIQARAFTTGRDVFFRQGEYQPRSRGGQALIAHELAHVVQQGARKSGKTTLQRAVTEQEMKQQNIDRGKKINQIKELLEKPIDDSQQLEPTAYQDERNKIKNALHEQYQKNIKFEQTYLVGKVSSKETEKHKIKTSSQEITLDLDEIHNEAKSLRKDADRALQIRKRLRTGAQKYRDNPQASIPELYAGTISEADEVNKGKSIFAHFINDRNWFTDTNGKPFIRHGNCRSAMIGYSPEGERGIPLHIGHRQKR